MEEKVIIELKDITKEFPGVRALDGVSMKIREGRIHALLGENGAGKSTLMKILSGTYSNYDGQIFCDGKEVHLKNNKMAFDMGISIVAQELNCVDELTIAENLYLGRAPLKCKGIIDSKKRESMTGEWLSFMGLPYNPDMMMGDLSVAGKQMIEILKSISRNCRVIIMDEPTSALTNVETKLLFDKIKKLKEKGIAFVFISHRLEEVFQICDDYSVLRDGKYIGSGKVLEVNQEKLISMMVGRKLNDIYPPVSPPKQKEMLRVNGLTSKGVFKDISFAIKEGEILGFAGMMGAGRSEIARTIFGMDGLTGGEIILDGNACRIKNVKDAVRRGIAMVTEDRGSMGFVGVSSIKNNIVLPNGDIYARHGILQNARIKNGVTDIFNRLAIKAPDTDTEVGTLSGGNQQKVVLAKWLVRNVKVLILDEPTRGIDVGAKQEIYKLIVQLAEQGMSILLISSDMPEVLSMSHRVMVVADGRIAGELQREEATQDKVMKMIVEAGTRDED